MSISKLELFHQLAFKEKSNFLQFIHRIGKNRIRKLFKFPGEDFSLWWFSLVAEKSTFKSDSYAKLIFSLLQGKEISEKTAKERIKEMFFYQFLNAIYTLCYLCIRALYIKSSLRNFDFRKRRLKEHRYIIVSYFPFVNENAARTGIFENGYLNSFHRVLEERCRNEYSHICMQLNLNGYNLSGSLKITRRFLKTQSLFYLEEFLQARHLFLIIFYYFYFSAIFFLNFNKIKKEIVYVYEGKRINVWGLFKEDFYKSFSGANLIFSLWYILLFKELIRYLRRDCKIISIYENQPWEKALCIFARKMQLKTIGFQHTAVPELLLSYFNAAQEIGSDNPIENCPLPDYVATVGRIPIELFTKYGWPKERVFIWGAQRFENLRLPDPTTSQKLSAKYFICAFSIDGLEAKRLLLMLEGAFNDGVQYQIFLKSHPALDLNKLVKTMRLRLNPDTFFYTETPIFKIIPEARGVIVTSSSSSFFALAFGVPIITPRFAGKLDCSSLSYISDIPIYAYSPQQLRFLCDRIAESSSEYRIGEKGRSFLRDYFYFPEEEYEYLKKITSL